MSDLEGKVYWIESGDLHFDIPKFLEYLGVEDTEKNRDLAVEVFLETARKYLPGAPRIVTTRVGFYIDF